MSLGFFIETSRILIGFSILFLPRSENFNFQINLHSVMESKWAYLN